MSLPKWFERPKEYPCFCLNCKKYRAFEIACVALKKVAEGGLVTHAQDEDGIDLNCVNVAEEALRCIKELGKNV